MKSPENGFQSRFSTLTGILALTLFAAPAIVSAEAAQAPGSAAVAQAAPAENAAPAKPKARVYTNADLAKLEPIPAQQVPIAGPGSSNYSSDGLDWNVILAQIDRQRAYEERNRDREMAYANQVRADKEREEYYNNYDQADYAYGFPYIYSYRHDYGPRPYPGIAQPPPGQPVQPFPSRPPAMNHPSPTSMKSSKGGAPKAR